MANVKVVIESINKGNGFQQAIKAADDFEAAIIKLIVAEKEVANTEKQMAADNAAIAHFQKMTQAEKDAYLESRKLTQATEQQSSAVQKAKFSFTEFNSAVQLVQQGAQISGQIWGATAAKTIEYADDVRKLSQASGASAEDTSRLIQVLDDYKISADQALASTRFLTKNGHVATLETLGQLSDKYLKLNTQQEKNAFVTQNLGRGGLAYISILEKGSAAIKAQGAAVSDNLILSQKVVDDARKQEIALDTLNDSWDGLMMTMGKTFIPIATDASNGLNVLIRALEIMKEKNNDGRTSYIGLGEATDMAGKAIWDEQQALLANKEATEGATESNYALVGSVEELPDATKEAEAQAKRMTSAYTGLLSAMFNIQSANDNYKKSIEDLDTKEKDIETKRAEALGKYLDKKSEIEQKVSRYNEDEGMSEQALADKKIALQQKLNDVRKSMGDPENAKASKQESLRNREKSLLEQIGKLSSGNRKNDIKDTRMQTDTQQKLTDALADYKKELDDLDKQQSGVEEDRVKASEDLKKQSKQRVYDLTQQRLAADGVITSDEYKYLQDVAVSMGLVTRASADQAIKESNDADIRVANFLKIQNPMATDLQIMQEMTKFSGTIVDFGVNYHSNQPPTGFGTSGNSYGTNGINYSQSFGYQQGSPMSVPMASRDSGGTGIAGQPYMIGTGAQPEVFIPNTNGKFVPNAGGATYNITVNNPKKETAENSIRTALRNLAFMGVAA
jgi:hypothetical protein